MAAARPRCAHGDDEKRRAQQRGAHQSRLDRKKRHLFGPVPLPQAMEDRLQGEVNAHASKLQTIETEVLGLLERRGRKIAAEDAEFLRGVIAANRAAPTFAAGGAVSGGSAHKQPPQSVAEAGAALGAGVRASFGLDAKGQQAGSTAPKGLF